MFYEGCLNGGVSNDMFVVYRRVVASAVLAPFAVVLIRLSVSPSLLSQRQVLPEPMTRGFSDVLFTGMTYRR